MSGSRLPKSPQRIVQLSNALCLIALGEALGVFRYHEKEWGDVAVFFPDHRDLVEAISGQFFSSFFQILDILMSTLSTSVNIHNSSKPGGKVCKLGQVSNDNFEKS
jgi:hypothetical protein